MMTARNFGTILGPHVMRDGERSARLCSMRARVGRLPSATWENGLPLFTGGQVVAGSNSVSPTRVYAGRRLVVSGLSARQYVAHSAHRATDL